MLTRGNIKLFPTTLIESNAMKKLITSILSAALLWPMWVVGQTTPTIAGTLTWSLNPGLSSGTITVYPPAIQGNCGPDTLQSGGTHSYEYPSCSITGTVTLTEVVVTAISNGNNIYSLSGYGSATIQELGDTTTTTFPSYGGMILSGNNYIIAMTASAASTGAAYFMQCTISSTTLNGTCIGNNRSTSPITLVTN